LGGSGQAIQSAAGAPWLTARTAPRPNIEP
jgi:hypothetical protein